MAIRKSERVPEKIYSVAMWVVSVVFAGFLIGLGNLILGDLPQLDDPVTQEQFVDQKGLDRLRGAADAIGADMDAVDTRLEVARLQLEQADKAAASGKETFDAWIRTRTATTSAAQDPEVIARTRQLEALQANQRAAQQAIDALSSERLALEQRERANGDAQQRLEAAAWPAFEKALFWQELKVFLWRLLFTLPLLLVAGWLILHKRKSDYWPLARGFVLAAIFAFFVELVPYLPSYGGYIRYIVGIVLTGIAGHFLIKNMRAYLERRQAVEVQAEDERRKMLSHEEAFKKMASNICPGCDRPVATMGDVKANYCVHCGMTLFNQCGGCGTRKMAFFRFCMACGTSADASKPFSPKAAIFKADPPADAKVAAAKTPAKPRT
jgi:hypothetical protein